MRFITAASALALVGLASAQQYDYIVAGAGAAGIIVASRLAEAGKEVLLIDRGHSSTASSGGQWATPWNSSLTYYDVPGLALEIYSKFGEDPQGSPFCTDVPDTAGCVLGGGTEVNMMAFVRPQSADFQRWPAGWKAPSMAAAESRLYARNPGTTLPSKDGKFYDQASWSIASKYFKNVGWSQVNMNQEVELKHQTYSHAALSAMDGLRAGPVQTYLPVARGMSNFHMLLGTNVLKVIRNGGKVTGVRVEKNGKRRTIGIKSSGRVILAAGTMSTPRILWYSAIGRPNTIAAIRDGPLGMGIIAQSNWINLPVGESLRNHNQIRIGFKTNHKIDFVNDEAYETPSQATIDNYNQRGSGIMAQTNQRGFFWTSITVPGGRPRFFQGTILPQSSGVVQFHVILTHGTTSSGVLGIDANSGATTFSKAPVLSTAADKKAYAQFLDQLIAYGKTEGSPLSFKAGTDGANGAQIIENTTPGKHYVGTCKMGTDDGRKNGGTAVVDTNTKVYGTDNLHVVDASIHPDLPTGNTQAIVMVAAEQAAAKILALDGASIA